MAPDLDLHERWLDEMSVVRQTCETVEDRWSRVVGLRIETYEGPGGAAGQAATLQVRELR